MVEKKVELYGLAQALDNTSTDPFVSMDPLTGKIEMIEELNSQEKIYKKKADLISKSERYGKTGQLNSLSFWFYRNRLVIEVETKERDDAGRLSHIELVVLLKKSPSRLTVKKDELIENLNKIIEQIGRTPVSEDIEQELRELFECVDLQLKKKRTQVKD